MSDKTTKFVERKIPIVDFVADMKINIEKQTSESLKHLDRQIRDT